MNLSNSYLSLKHLAYDTSLPQTAPQPTLVLWNEALADALHTNEASYDEKSLKEQDLSEIFSGNQRLPGPAPIALAYAGHQFGHFAAQLGDGRAHLLGELQDKQGRRLDIQLKGSGVTAYSRGGDGRCALGPAVREFIMSEAMHALGVPTTRALAVVTTGETVFREGPRPGAVLTRIASSHVRVGSFQYYAARGDITALKELADYCIDRHYPHLHDAADTQPYVALLESVIEKQQALVVEWMRVGFIHGVLNTDNTTISGEAIDYGPCAMLNAYHPKTAFSSIDQMGRYAFGNQASVMQWNMARLAESLLPIIDQDSDQALALVEPLIQAFPQKYQARHAQMMAAKLGLPEATSASSLVEYEALSAELLGMMQKHGLDYTQTFINLTDSLSDERLPTNLHEYLADWWLTWRQTLASSGVSPVSAQAHMRQVNPRVIPRNHHVEAVLEAAVERGDFSAAEQFLRVLRQPYENLSETAQYMDAPADGDRYYQTFCGT